MRSRVSSPSVGRRFGLLFAVLPISLLLSLFLPFCTLTAQQLPEPELGYLMGESILPQDRVLGLMYIPDSRSGRQILALVRDFWNRLNAGELNASLLSEDGRIPIREQVAPFLRDAPALKASARRFGPKLGLVRVRLGNPLIEREYARLRCRLELDRGFVVAGMFFVQNDDGWLLDALDIQWEDIFDSGNRGAFRLFGGKRVF